jgi:hypothetical protein
MREFSLFLLMSSFFIVSSTCKHSVDGGSAVLPPPPLDGLQFWYWLCRSRGRPGARLGNLSEFTCSDKLRS